MPIVNSIFLLRSVSADPAFEFKKLACWLSFAAITPDGVQKSGACRKGGPFHVLEDMELLRFTKLVHVKIKLIFGGEHVMTFKVIH
mgnify:CR=1 FL=1